MTPVKTSRVPLRPILALAAAIAATGVLAARAQVPDFPDYEKKPGVFATAQKPETCISCHTSAAPPVLEPKDGEERHDVVVVGAGLAGLTAAFKLQDRDVLVLEKDADAGGKIKSDRWEGVHFSQGATYCVEPEDDTKELFDALGIAPQEIAEPETAMLFEGRDGKRTLVLDPWRTGVDSLPYPKEARERLKEAFKAIGDLAGDIAVPARASPEALLELDKVPAVEFFNQYGPELVEMMSPYIRTCFAIEIDEVSALGALTFLACEFAPIYSFPGGLTAVIEKLVEKIGAKRIRCGAYVTEVAPSKEGVRVVYRDAQGKPHAVRARAAIVTIPQNAAKYIVKGLSEERRDVMSKVFHGGYAVAALKTSKPVWTKAYDTWLIGQPVTDVVVQDWVAKGGKVEGKGKAVLNANMPLGTAGRAELLGTPVEDIKKKFMACLEPRFPGLKESLVGMEIYFYGHAMHVAFPGYVTEVTAKLAEPIEGKIFFAGAELDLPAFESAIWSGVDAAKQVRAVLGGQ